ncbi:MAG: flagellar hook-associated protein FlgK, partial [Gammaproteobacteria bacterium]|nr:flagellar hook-associated protein FlgK [Gammaproteobacteria bacterium]
MSNFLNTGVTGLLAFQRALATTSHNIANANTPGFSRQQAVLAARVGLGSASLTGQGTEIQTVRRVYDQYLVGQVHVNTAAYSRLESFHSLSTQVDNLLADGGNGVGVMLQEFFNSIDAMADDPASLVTREALLGQARALTDRFGQADSRLNALDRDVNNRLQNSVSEINAIAESIAQLNRQIVTSSSGGQLPNDLLDRRDALLTELNQHVNVTSISQGDGSLNVFIGNGLVLVRSGSAEALATEQNEFEPGRLDVRLANGPNITSRLSGGAIGGALDFRREVLDPARNGLGRMATALATSLNQQHRAGMTLQGQLGGDLFAIGAPLAQASAANSGAASVTVSVSDVGALTTHDYRLSFDGGAWQLRHADSGQPVAMTGSGTGADPFVADGVEIVISGGAAAAGDDYLLRPTAGAAAGLELLVENPADLAAAAAVIATSELGNTGNAEVSAGVVIDSTDPNLLTPQTITFIDPSNYTIGGAGPFAYTSGDDIDFNGWRVTISGSPEAGDIFNIAPNTSGNADNRNALLISEIQSIGVLDAGSSSLSDGFGRLTA